MRLNPDAFNRHLNNMGQQFIWRQSFQCPCINPRSGQATVGCPQCGGKGHLWIAGVPAVAGVASASVQQQWAAFGMWQDGDAVLSIGSDSPMYEMAQYDRVTMLNNTNHFSYPMTRGAPSERLFVSVQKITRVFWLDANKAIVEGGIPTVAADGTLSWTTGAPPAGTQYSISGTAYSEYFCYGGYPASRMEHSGARLPRRVVLRRFDLFGRDAPTSTT
jgi:hypothetical protein